MYCPQCGTQRPPDCKFCANCGAAQAPMQPQQPQQQTPYNAYAQPYFNRQHPYKRIGGMLRWFQVSLIIAAIWMPFYLWFQLRTLTAAPLMGAHILSITTLIMMLLTQLTMLLLLLRKPIFLRVYEITVLVMLAGFLAYDVYLLFTMGTFMFIVQLFITFWGVGLTCLWFLYYTRSVRVRTYMGTDEYVKRSIFFKRVTPPNPAVPDEIPPQQY